MLTTDAEQRWKAQAPMLETKGIAGAATQDTGRKSANIELAEEKSETARKIETNKSQTESSEEKERKRRHAPMAEGCRRGRY